MQAVGQSYGQALPDQVERIATLFDAHLELIGDVHELYRDRAALEREYAAKLHLLAKKAFDKKSKMEASFIIGNEPTKAWDANTLRKNSLNVAYDEILNSIVSTAQDHVNIADVLASQVVEVLRGVEKKNEEAKKKEILFFQKLLADRDRVYAERLKSKQKYDEDCNEVDSLRQKQGRVQDDKHADRVAKQAEQQRNDMLSSKNVYLISIALANQSKVQFYDFNLPTLENELQSLECRLVERTIKILEHGQALQLSHLDTLKSRLGVVQKSLEKVNPARDQELFIEYNIRPFLSPNDWVFEPCTTHYDTNDMSIEASPKIFLQNKLIRCRSKLEELTPLYNEKQRELDGLSKEVSAHQLDHGLGTIDDVWSRYQETRHQLVFYTASKRILNAEIDTIIAAIGVNDQGAQQPHSFKSAPFSIPTQCEYCKTSIWGLSKQGKTCRLCGISVHARCELKVPADCEQTEDRHQSILSRFTSRTSSDAPASQASTATSFVKSVASEEPHEESYPSARVLFNFTATSEFELGVSEGELIRVVEGDDGSGWVKVADLCGRDGLVPASYLEHVDSVSSVNQQSSGQQVRAIYSYAPQGGDELALREGELIKLTSGPTGGQEYGDGWWEGLNSRGEKGIFPSNYVGSELSAIFSTWTQQLS